LLAVLPGLCHSRNRHQYRRWHSLEIPVKGAKGLVSTLHVSGRNCHRRVR
jgi:hypothetical protein